MSRHPPIGWVTWHLSLFEAQFVLSDRNGGLHHSQRWRHSTHCHIYQQVTNVTSLTQRVTNVTHPKGWHGVSHALVKGASPIGWVTWVWLTPKGDICQGRVTFVTFWLTQRVTNVTPCDISQGRVTHWVSDVTFVTFFGDKKCDASHLSHFLGKCDALAHEILTWEVFCHILSEHRHVLAPPVQNFFEREEMWRFGWDWNMFFSSRLGFVTHLGSAKREGHLG